MKYRIDFTLSQLQYFAAVAECGSMTAATTALHISQSALSTSISKLEKQLGVQLFIRHPAKGLSCTPEGTQFLREARDLLQLANDVTQNTIESSRGLSGTISLGCFGPLSPFYVPSIIAEAKQVYPDLRIEIIERNVQELLESMRTGHCDLTITYDFHQQPTDVHQEILATVRPYVIVPPDNALASRTEGIDLSELSNETIILLDLPHSREYFESLVTDRGFRVTLGHRSSSYETVRALVAKGLGCAILNHHPVSNSTYGNDEVVALPLLGEVPELALALVWPKGVRRTARVVAMQDLCRTVVSRIAVLQGV